MSAKEDIFEPIESVLPGFTPSIKIGRADWQYKRAAAVPSIIDAGQVLDSRLPKGREHDELLMLVQRLFLAPAPMSTKSIMFCGIGNNDSSHVCANAGRILARQTGAKVCLVDANVQHGELSSQFDLDDRFAMHGKLVPWREQCASVAKNLFVGGTGLLAGTEGKLASTSEIRDRIMVLTSSFDYLLFDAPGVNTSSDAALLGQLVGAAVLVFDAKATHKTEARKAKERLETVNVRIFGAVLNNY
jgi:Mrp family chromosome partitioning ATPase